MTIRRSAAGNSAATGTELSIEDLSHDGRGVARLDGKIVFVPGALPGERVQARIVGRHRRFDEAQLLGITRASPDRRTPPCTHYGRCGGCSLQHLDVAAQLRWKQRHLEQTLRRIGKLEPARWLEPATGPACGYRLRARFGVLGTGESSRSGLGFRGRGTRRIEPIDSCVVLEPAVESLIAPLGALLTELRAPGIYREILVAAGEAVDLPPRAVCLVAHAAPSAEDRRALASFAAAGHAALYLQIDGAGDPVRLDGETEQTLHYSPWPGLRLAFQPWHFVQTNRAVNRALVSRAIDLLEPCATDRMLDLYCGLGNFALPFACRAGEVIGVEGDDGLLAWARRNARDNGLDNVSFLRADLSQAPERAHWSQTRCELVLLDPPRSGASALLATVASLQPRGICYVSCDPATLARDAETLTRRYDFRLAAAGILDMFPHTSHVESIALFVR